jgi:hypothetical protein
LLREFRGEITPRLPAKKPKMFCNHVESSFVRKRRRELFKYINDLLLIPEAASSSSFLKFMGV